jgi:histidinol-phosphate aminotransferase
MSAALKSQVKPRKAIEEMPEYHPPLAGRNALRLDFNENTERR